MVELKKIFRQAKESDIIVNAHRINNGEQISLDNKSRDFFLLERNDTNVIYKHMIQLIQEKLPRYVKATPFDIQVLTPMRKGGLGCETLNGILQRYLNPADGRKKEHMNGDTIYREGDKVMQVKNNYQLEWEVVSKYGIPVDRGVGVFNGDMGRVLEIQEAASCLVVEYDEQRRVTYPFSLLDELELSYAITIHKSQGSEYPAVLLPLLGGPRMLFNRNLLYTAITRELCHDSGEQRHGAEHDRQRQREPPVYGAGGQDRGAVREGLCAGRMRILGRASSPVRVEGGFR